MPAGRAATWLVVARVASMGPHLQAPRQARHGFPFGLARSLGFALALALSSESFALFSGSTLSHASDFECSVHLLFSNSLLISILALSKAHLTKIV